MEQLIAGINFQSHFEIARAVKSYEVRLHWLSGETKAVLADYD